MTPRGDDGLRARFGELREADERAAPGYHAVLERRVSPEIVRTARRLPSRIALALGAAAIVLAVGVARVTRRAAFVPPPLSTWTSPTASLLVTPGIEMISSHTLVSSMLDPVTAKSTLRTGTPR